MVTEEPKSIGQRIRQSREKKNFNVQELAKLAGCSDEYLGWVEDGQVEP